MYVLSPAALSDARILAAYVIFFASYVVFALGKFPGLKIDRTGAAIIGAVGMVAFRIVRPREALRYIDFSTIVLLFSMMLTVGNLHLVGFFEWSAEAVLRRLKPHQLLPAVIFTCGVLSAFFVNDIVCLVMVPFVLNLTRRMGLGPMPYLLAVATASNIGGIWGRSPWWDSLWIGPCCIGCTCESWRSSTSRRGFLSRRWICRDSPSR
jgi:Na+/H+ antiporter NhaD/arsenite permease-like protein